MSVVKKFIFHMAVSATQWKGNFQGHEGFVEEEGPARNKQVFFTFLVMSESLWPKVTSSLAYHSLVGKRLTSVRICSEFHVKKKNQMYCFDWCEKLVVPW